MKQSSKKQSSKGAAKPRAPQPLIRFAPEVEARRADYMMLAEALINMTDL